MPKKSNKQRILVSGSRCWTDREAVAKLFKEIKIWEAEVLIHGNARGLDRMAADVALDLGMPPSRIKSFPARWLDYGRSAGPIRNSQMLKDASPTHVYCFPLPGGEGTMDLYTKADKAGLNPVIIKEIIKESGDKKNV